MKKNLEKHENMVCSHFFKNSVLFTGLVLSSMTPIFANSSPVPSHTSQIQEKQTYRGIVKDTEGLGAIGVNVTVKGTKVGTITDFDGKFTIKAIPGQTLVFSYVGYATKEVVVGGNTNLSIQLQEDTQAIDEVVVVGYGSQKKVNVTGAITQVNAEQLKERPVQNVTQALQGMVPGLNITTSSSGGELDGSMNLNIRGTGTIGEGSTSSPLVLIDGVEGSLQSLNPQDIENISVLKDVAASSIYGSRAPFGVILITTKSGKKGRTTLNYNNNFRVNQPIGVADMADSYQFAQLWNTASLNDGGSAIFDQEKLDRILAYQNGTAEGSGSLENTNGLWSGYGNGYANTDWFDVHYKDYSLSNEHNLSLNGGTEKIQYRVAGNLMNSNGVLTFSDDAFDRYTITAKIDAEVTSWIDLTYNTRWVRETYDRSSYQGGLLYHNLTRRWPTCAVVDDFGHYTEWSEINQLIDGGRDQKTQDNYVQQLSLKLEPVKGWNIIAEGSYKTYSRNQNWNVLPVFQHDINGDPVPMKFSGDYAAGATRAYEENSKSDYWNTNIYTSYGKTTDSHSFKVLAGFNAELMQSRFLSGQRDGLIIEDLPVLDLGTSNQRASNNYQHWATAGFFGRINYDYKERYLLEVNTRYDGTSRFLEDQRWNIFPSFSAGWNIAREEFWADNLDKLSTFKLRGSWGELGNQNTSSYYPFYPSMSVSAESGSWLINGEKPNISSMPGLVSSTLTWERIRSWNIGLDLASFNNRLTGSFDYFVRQSFDMVSPGVPLPDVLGTGVPSTNNADLESRGFEIELSWRDRIGKVNYGIRGVLSDAQQEVTNYNNPTNEYWRYYNGKKFGEIWGYTSIDLARTEQEMIDHLATLPNGGQSALGTGWKAGDVMYKDMNGDGVINSGKGTLDDHGDISIIGNSTPRFNYGITLDASWNGFDASMFWQGVGKRDYAAGGSYFWGTTGGLWQSMGLVEHLDYYRPEDHTLGANIDAYYPNPYFNNGKNTKTQTMYLQDASYLRLKNLQIGYTIPSAWVKKAGLQSMRIFASGDNLLTFTKLSSIFDPETISGSWGDGKAYPLSRVYSFGININL